MAADKRLYRKRDSALAGVCSGLAEYFEVDVLVVRILVVLLSLATFSLGAFVYLAMWAVVPVEPEKPIPYEVQPENPMSSMRNASTSGVVHPVGPKVQPQAISTGARNATAIGLVLLFFVVSLNVAPLVSGTEWWQYWPIAPLLVGLCLIVIPARTKYEGAWHALGIVIVALAATLVPLSVGDRKSVV